MNEQEKAAIKMAHPLKIALIGYGKMGKAIETAALLQGHEIVLKISSGNAAELNAANLRKADIAIEFTHPDIAVTHIKQCIDAGIPVVCGSTGWLSQWDETVTYCREKNGSFLYASNFSIGVNVIFEINRKLAHLMSKCTGYDVEIEEVHHTQKKDAPSGTAITLAEDILKSIPYKSYWVKGAASGHTELSIHSKRIDPAPGTHIVTYKSAVDDIEIKHTAHNREGFASGAVLAATFLVGKKGIFSMKDVLGMD